LLCFITPSRYCGGSDDPAANFNDGTGCACKWGYTYDTKAQKCVGGPGPDPGVVCTDSAGRPQAPCPTGDDQCCANPKGWVSCMASKTEE
jgi:hypothetical protein